MFSVWAALGWKGVWVLIAFQMVFLASGLIFRVVGHIVELILFSHNLHSYKSREGYLNKGVVLVIEVGELSMTPLERYRLQHTQLYSHWALLR